MILLFKISVLLVKHLLPGLIVNENIKEICVPHGSPEELYLKFAVYGVSSSKDPILTLQHCT
jgi:hypothetical protein